jgi:hypothetical protein
MHVNGLALVKLHNLSVKIYKAQKTVETGVGMVQCFHLWQDR